MNSRDMILPCVRKMLLIESLQMPIQYLTVNQTQLMGHFCFVPVCNSLFSMSVATVSCEATDKLLKSQLPEHRKAQCKI